MSFNKIVYHNKYKAFVYNMYNAYVYNIRIGIWQLKTFNCANKKN